MSVSTCIFKLLSMPLASVDSASAVGGWLADYREVISWLLSVGSGPDQNPGNTFLAKCFGLHQRSSLLSW